MRTAPHVMQHRHCALENVLYFIILLANIHVRGVIGVSRGDEAVQLEPATLGGSALGDLQIGSFQGGADIVTNGIVQAPWSPMSPNLVGPNEKQTRLWAVVANVATHGVRLTALSVTSMQPDIADAHLRWTTDSSHKKIMIGSVLKPLVVDVVYDCHRAGSTGLKVAYRFADARIAPVELSFTKECGQRARVGLSLGTRADQPDDVVKNGFARWSLETALERIIPPSQAYIDLFWALHPTGGGDDTISQSMAPPRTKVTPLSLHINPGKDTPIVEMQRWKSHLRRIATKEQGEKNLGLWGLDSTDGVSSKSTSSQQRKLPEVARVQIIGALQDGGYLPAVSQLPADAPPPGFRLNVECLRMGAALIEVEVSPAPAYQPYHPTVLSFVKQCGGVISHGFDVGSHMLTTRDVAPDILKDSVPVESTNGGFAGEVNNLRPSLSVYWRLADASLGPPDATSVTCEGNVVSASLVQPQAPTPAQGMLAGRQDVQFQCRRSGDGWCTLHFAWQLYEGPSVRFRKECGGIRNDVEVFSDMANTPAVFLQGRTPKVWGDRPEVTLPADDDKTVFTVALDPSLAPGSKILNIAAPQLRVYRPDIVEAFTAGELVDGGEVGKGSDGGLDLEVQTKCKKTGTSRIEVTVPIKSLEPFKPLSFAFNKHCDVVPRWQHSLFMSSLSFVIVLCLFAGIAMVCLPGGDKHSGLGPREMHRFP